MHVGSMRRPRNEKRETTKTRSCNGKESENRLHEEEHVERDTV